jgi:hypothetical protein
MFSPPGQPSRPFGSAPGAGAADATSESVASLAARLSSIEARLASSDHLPPPDPSASDPARRDPCADFAREVASLVRAPPAGAAPSDVLDRIRALLAAYSLQTERSQSRPGPGPGPVSHVPPVSSGPGSGPASVPGIGPATGRQGDTAQGRWRDQASEPPPVFRGGLGRRRGLAGPGSSGGGGAGPFSESFWNPPILTNPSLRSV